MTGYYRRIQSAILAATLLGDPLHHLLTPPLEGHGEEKVGGLIEETGISATYARPIQVYSLLIYPPFPFLLHLFILVIIALCVHPSMSLALTRRLGLRFLEEWTDEFLSFLFPFI